MKRTKFRYKQEKDISTYEELLEYVHNLPHKFFEQRIARMLVWNRGLQRLS